MAALGWFRQARTETRGTAVQVGTPRIPAEAVVCSQPGCAGELGWRCSYKDPTKAQCRTSWCREHAVVVNGQPYCRRHAEVVKILQSIAGTLSEVPTRPLLEDRTLGVIMRVTDELGADVVKLLQERYQDRPGVSVKADASVRAVFSKEGGLIWEMGWAAFTVEGYLSRLTLRVREGEPPRVELKGDGGVIFVGVPDWIASRRQDWLERHPDAPRFHELAAAAVAGWLAGYPPEGEYRLPSSLVTPGPDPEWEVAEPPRPAKAGRRR